MEKAGDIQLLRGDHSKISTSEKYLLPGQPLFDKDTNQLIIGHGEVDEETGKCVTPINEYDVITTDHVVKYDSTKSPIFELMHDTSVELDGTTTNTVKIKVDNSDLLTLNKKANCEGLEINAPKSKCSISFPTTTGEYNYVFPGGTSGQNFIALRTSSNMFSSYNSFAGDFVLKSNSGQEMLKFSGYGGDSVEHPIMVAGRMVFTSEVNAPEFREGFKIRTSEEELVPVSVATRKIGDNNENTLVIGSPDKLLRVTAHDFETNGGDIIVGGNYDENGAYAGDGSADAVIVGSWDPDNKGLITTKKGINVRNTSNNGNAVTISNGGEIVAATLKCGNSTISNDSIHSNGSITAVGNITSDNEITAFSFNAKSDKRLKENIEAYYPKQSILDLPVYSYNFINDSNKTQHIGCLAQDLQKICPEIVHENDKGFLSIEENKLVYLLLEEVKQLNMKVKELEAK